MLLMHYTTLEAYTSKRNLRAAATRITTATTVHIQTTSQSVNVTASTTTIAITTSTDTIRITRQLHNSVSVSLLLVLQQQLQQLLIHSR
jgi:hypothetical protein